MPVCRRWPAQARTAPIDACVQSGVGCLNKRLVCHLQSSVVLRSAEACGQRLLLPQGTAGQATLALAGHCVCHGCRLPWGRCRRFKAMQVLQHSMSSSA